MRSDEVLQETEMKIRPVEEILNDVLKLMDSFSTAENEDRPSNYFFKAELNADSFYILRNEIVTYIKD